LPSYLDTGIQNQIASNLQSDQQQEAADDNLTNIKSPSVTYNNADLQSAGNSAGNAAASTAASGGVSALLKALGIGGASAATIAGLSGLLSAIGQYKQNSAYAPTFNPPALFGGAAGTAVGSQASGTSTGFGPAGGYNWQNYQGATASTPGLGYAPRTQVNPNIPNYYTYGQGPQATFFSSGTPVVGTQPTSQIGAVSQNPVSSKRGGRVMKKAIGGFTAPLQTGLPPQGNPVPTMQLPARPAVPQLPQRQMGPPATATGSMGMPSNTPFAGLAPGGMSGGMPNTGMSAPNTGMLPPRPQNPGLPPMSRMATGGSTMPSAPILSSNGAGLKQVAMPRQVTTPSRLPPAQNVQRDGMASGRHVKGPGDGTSDSIPARLATGEYVMDAQTVSMAGNGDNSAGAKAFDKMRENIRKHKGAALAKGKMAPDAKPLEKYMGGKS
jgi:hypothetical protein